MRQSRPPPLPPSPSSTDAAPRRAYDELPKLYGGGDDDDDDDDGLPSVYDDDDDDEEVTFVGAMPEAVKAMRQGYRKAGPAFVDDRPDIEILAEEDLDLLFIEELLEDGPVDLTPKIGLAAHGATDRGRRRKVNQDAALTMPEEQVFLIADGMGGHVAGEVASRLAVEVVETAIRSATFEGEPNLLWPELGDELARAVEMANLRIFEQAEAEGLDGMGTTVTAARFSLNRQRVYVAHVGDSRCYRIRQGRIEQLTEDHTIANLMGVIGPLGAQLSRAVGVEPTVEVDLLVDVPQIGDFYLLCTDGLMKMVPDESILAVIDNSANLVSAVQALIDESNLLGGKDNIGIVLVEVRPPAP